MVAQWRRRWPGRRRVGRPSRRWRRAVESFAGRLARRRSVAVPIDQTGIEGKEIEIKDNAPVWRGAYARRRRRLSRAPPPKRRRRGVAPPHLPSGVPRLGKSPKTKTNHHGGLVEMMG